uniref:Secreted protein n=1 Tax=Heterorhabditis bacteriophora TaxID=37862 RepID=A0A1I7WNI6_HETBA
MYIFLFIYSYLSAPECRTHEKRPNYPPLLPKRRWEKSAEAKASTHESPDKLKAKLTGERTSLKVFQTNRPFSTKRIAGSVVYGLFHD